MSVAVSVVARRASDPRSNDLITERIINCGRRSVTWPLTALLVRIAVLRAALCVMYEQGLALYRLKGKIEAQHQSPIMASGLAELRRLLEG